MKRSDGKTEIWRIIGLFPDGENGEDVIRVRSILYGDYESDFVSGDLWPNTRMYTLWKNVYSTTIYKNTVDYKMYLGTSDNYLEYTPSDLYNMERILNNKGSAVEWSDNGKIYIGSVGLMYPSDNGYGVLSSDCARSTTTYNYSLTATCLDKNWLYNDIINGIPFFITPDFSNGACFLFDRHLICSHDLPASGSFSPVMALKADVEVTGSGTQSNPYIMK